MASMWISEVGCSEDNWWRKDEERRDDERHHWGRGVNGILRTWWCIPIHQTAVDRGYGAGLEVALAGEGGKKQRNKGWMSWTSANAGGWQAVGLATSSLQRPEESD